MEPPPSSSTTIVPSTTYSTSIPSIGVDNDIQQRTMESSLPVPPGHVSVEGIRGVVGVGSSSSTGGGGGVQQRVSHPVDADGLHYNDTSNNSHDNEINHHHHNYNVDDDDDDDEDIDHRRTTTTTSTEVLPITTNTTTTNSSTGTTTSIMMMNHRGRTQHTSSTIPSSTSSLTGGGVVIPPVATVAPTTTTTVTTMQQQQQQQRPIMMVPPTTPMTASTMNNNNSTIMMTPTNTTTTPTTIRSMNAASDINNRLDTQVEVRVYPCNTSAGTKKKFTTFTIKPEGVIIQGNRNHTRPGSNTIDLGTEYGTQIGRKLCRYELTDNRACQLLVTTHGKNFWVVPAPEAFSRHSGTCRLLGDRKHPPAPHVMQVGDFLRVGSVGVVVIETHDGTTNCILSEEKIQRIMKDTTATNGFLDLAETDGENSDDSMDGQEDTHRSIGDDVAEAATGDHPVCYMCFDEEDTAENPMITPCKCSGDTKYVHVECLRKWHTAEADNQICFLSSVDATCSVCKSTFKSDFKLSDGRQVKLFKSSLEPPYVSLLVATKHEMAQRLFNTRFQLSFSTLMKPDGRNATRPLLLGRSSGSDMVLDYRTVSARHAAIRLKNGEFIFTDAGSSNGSYLYLRRPLELNPSQAVQFRLGRSMISMKVVNKWNRRLLRAVRGQRPGSTNVDDDDDAAMDDRSIGSVDGDIRITADQTVEAVQRRTRDSVMASLPPPGQLSQSSSKHLDLLYALAYPKREPKAKMDRTASSISAAASPVSNQNMNNVTTPDGNTTTPISPMSSSLAALTARMTISTPNNNNNTNHDEIVPPATVDSTNFVEQQTAI